MHLSKDKSKRLFSHTSEIQRFREGKVEEESERSLTGDLSEAVGTAGLVCHSCQIGRDSPETWWPRWSSADRDVKLTV